MTYIGLSPPNTFTKSTSQTFTGNGSTTAFTLQTRVASPEDLEVFVSNVQQQPTESYTIGSDGVTMTFSEAPPSGTFYVIYRTVAQQAGTDTGASRLGENNTFTGTQTFNADVSFPDNVKAKFGTGNDLEIYHSGTASFISDTGTGNLRLTTNKLNVMNANNDSDMIKATEGGQVKLYNDGNEKLATLGAGIKITGSLDMNGGEVILDADGDTSITADTDDQIDIKIGGTDEVTLSSSGVVINEGGNDRDFRIESNSKANMFCVDAGNDSVIIGHNAKITAVGNLDANLQLISGNAQPSLDILCFSDNANHRGQVTFSKSANDTIGTGTAVGTSDLVGDIVWGVHDGTDFANEIAFIRGAVDSTGVGANDTGGMLQFGTSSDGNNSGTERMRIDEDGNIIANANTSTDTVIYDNASGSHGPILHAEFRVDIARSATMMSLNSTTSSSSSYVDFRRAGGSIGSISHNSASTVSYNAFTGSHWGRLLDNSKPTILKGTVLETIDEMCDWYEVEFTIPEVKYVDGDAIPKDKKVGDVKTKAQDKKYLIPLADIGSKKLGDSFTFTYKDGVEYTGTLKLEDEEKHSKCKVSDTADSKRVYGVFFSWDGEDDGYNDMYVAGLGTYVVRVHKDVTVESGDLLVSNGDGTAKKQSDDIIRTKTIGKVLTNIKQETYSDGSYTVPCALYCG